MLVKPRDQFLHCYSVCMANAKFTYPKIKELKKPLPNELKKVVEILVVRNMTMQCTLGNNDETIKISKQTGLDYYVLQTLYILQHWSIHKTI